MIISDNRDLINVVSLYDKSPFLTKGKYYILERGPDVINPINFNKNSSYIVKCDTGGYIKADLNEFVDLIEIREEKLNSLGI